MAGRNEINVVAKIDADDLIRGLRRSSKEFSNFENAAGRTGKKVKSSFTGLTKVTGGLTKVLGGLGIAFGGVQALKTAAEFAELSRAEEDARNALIATVGSLAEYDSVIGSVRDATRGMISETDAAAAANVFLAQGLAKNAGEAAKLINAGTVLSQTFESQGASMELFTRLLSSGSAVLLDNFNISQAQVAARQKEIEASLGLSTQEARLQAIREIAIASAEKYSDAISEDTIVQAQAAATAKDAGAAIGDLLSPAITKATELTTAFLETAREGAEAWVWIRDVAVPSIRELKQELDNQAAATLNTLDTQEALRTVLTGQVSDYGVLRSSLVNASQSYQEYNKRIEEFKSLDVDGELGLHIRALKLSSVEWDTMRTGMMAAERAEIAAMQAAVDLAREERELKTVLAEINTETLAFAESLNTLATAQSNVSRIRTRRAQIEGGSQDVAAFNGLEAVTGLGMDFVTEKQKILNIARINEIADEMDEIKNSAKSAADSLASDFEGAFNKLKGIVDNVVKPSLEEVWKPPANEANFDEDSRRLATIATSGFSSEWLSTLESDFAGQDFFEPIIAAMQGGDEGKLKEAATEILRTNVSALWDPEIIKEQVRAQVAESNMRQEFIDAITAELAGEGIDTAAAFGEGQESPIAGLLGEILGGGEEGEGGLAGALEPMLEQLNTFIPEAIEVTTDAFTVMNELMVEEWGAVTDQYILLTETSLPALDKAHAASVAAMLTSMIGLTNQQVITTNSMIAGFSGVKSSIDATHSPIDDTTTKLSSLLNRGEAVEAMLIRLKGKRGGKKLAAQAADIATEGVNIGARQHGGPVAAGGTFLVGERGPELFQPGTSGNITANNKLGGLTIGTVILHGVQDPRALFEAIEREARARGKHIPVVR